ncbi:hypothetical protein EJB05_13577, partial [Eragrostis curvula]
MEKATKWDRVVHANHQDNVFVDHLHHHPRPSSSSTKSPHSMVALLESELAMARACVAELEDERCVTEKRLDRFLRKLEDEKSAWKQRTRHAVLSAREELRLEWRHRRALASANARLARDLADARRGHGTEHRAWELMEEACSELTREVEVDQAEVEMLRRECLRLREKMEEERRMLQMSEVWREERVQMKLSDARLALEGKYAQLHHLQAEMEAFLLRGRDRAADKDSLREAHAIVGGDDVAVAAAASLLWSSPRSHDNGKDGDDDCSRQDEKVDVDAVFEHFRRWEKEKARESGAKPNDVAAGRYSPASSASNLDSVSPATDLFLAKADDDGDDPYSDGSAAIDDDPCSWIGTSEPSISVARTSNNGSGSGVTENRSSTGAGSRRSGGAKHTALIRRLWRSAITESRKRTGPATRSGGGT